MVARTAAALVLATTIASLIAGGSSRNAVVPDVVGLNVDSAYEQLRRAGFAIGIDDPINMGFTDSPHVAHQSVAGGSAAPHGGVIVLSLDHRSVVGLRVVETRLDDGTEGDPVSVLVVEPA